MRITRTHAAAFIGAIALALAAPSLSAQTPTPARPERPAVVPELPQQPEAEAPERTYRYYRPVVRVGQDYTLRQGEEVRDVRTVFGDVLIEGRVTRDVVVVLGSAHLASTAIVDGALVVVAGTAIIDEGAAVHGDLVVSGGTLEAPADFSPGGDHVVVGTPGLGSAFRGLVPWFTRGLLWGRLIVPGLGWIWTVVGITFLLGLLVNTLFDRAVAGCADTIGQRPLSAFLLGLLVAVLIVPAIVILAATVVGLIVVPFVVCALILAGIVGKVGVARSIGRGIIRPETPEQRVAALFAFVFGAAVLVFLYMVPAIGVLTWGVTGVLGLGAAASTFRAGLRREQPPRPAAPAEPTPVPPSVAAPPAPGIAEGEPVYAAAAAIPPAEAAPPVSEVVAPPPVPAPAAPPAAPALPPGGPHGLSARDLPGSAGGLCARLRPRRDRGAAPHSPKRRRRVPADAAAVPRRVLGVEGDDARRHHLLYPHRANGRHRPASGRCRRPRPVRHLLRRRARHRLLLDAPGSRTPDVARQDRRHARRQSPKAHGRTLTDGSAICGRRVAGMR